MLRGMYENRVPKPLLKDGVFHFCSIDAWNTLVSELEQFAGSPAVMVRDAVHLLVLVMWTCACACRQDLHACGQ